VCEAIIQPSPKKAILLRNRNCVYCGVDLNKDTGSTREHVIGRRFVRKGSLSSQWNLIVRACELCNRTKSDLEDEISAISMQPDLFGQFPSEDERLKFASSRKADRSFSRRTKKRIGDSKETLNGNATCCGPDGCS
jgi:hypothetical protein